MFKCQIISEIEWPSCQLSHLQSAKEFLIPSFVSVDFESGFTCNFSCQNFVRWMFLSTFDLCAWSSLKYVMSFYLTQILKVYSVSAKKIFYSVPQYIKRTFFAIWKLKMLVFTRNKVEPEAMDNPPAQPKTKVIFSEWLDQRHKEAENICHLKKM